MQYNLCNTNMRGISKRASENHEMNQKQLKTNHREMVLDAERPRCVACHWQLLDLSCILHDEDISLLRFVFSLNWCPLGEQARAYNAWFL